MVGAGAGLYVSGTGYLTTNTSGRPVLLPEAAIDALAVDSTLNIPLAEIVRTRGRLGNFFQDGSSFPSDHSAVAWSMPASLRTNIPAP